MLITVTKLVTLLCAGLLAGAVFAVWVADRPFNMQARFYVEFQQARIASMTIPMPVLGGVTTLLALCCAALFRAQNATFYLALLAFLCCVAGMSITVAGNMPINNQIVTWQPDSPPSNWQSLRDQWWLLHSIRTVLSMAAFTSLLLAIVLPAK